MAAPDAAAVYKKGSLAALRAERAHKKQQFENKNNILMPSITPSSSNSLPPIHTKTPSIESVSEDDKDNKNTNHESTDSVTGYIDEYGFFVSEEEIKDKKAEIGSNTHRNIVRKQNERTHKWLHMLDDWDTYNTTKKAKLKSRIRKGIPPPVRAKVWKQIVGVSELTKEQRLYYTRLKHRDPQDRYKSSIDNDLDRTFPRHVLFTKADRNSDYHSPLTPTSSGRGKESLRNVLYAFANHDDEVGYTQGMGFIAALLLMLMTEEDAFWSLCRLLDQNGEYQLRGLYMDGLPLLHCRYYQFNELLLKFMPKVYEKINGFEITPALYASKWFITIFCYEFPFDFVYRIWDVYLHEGIKFVFRVSLALIKMNESAILKINQFDEMMKYLQKIHRKRELIGSIDQLLKTAFDLPLKHEHLETIENQYNRDRLAEQRRKGRGRNKIRDVSEMEPPAFLKKMSKKKENDDDDDKEKKENVNSNEGSHSASSYAEEEPSSVLPSHGKDKDIIVPHQDSDNEILNANVNGNSTPTPSSTQ